MDLKQWAKDTNPNLKLTDGEVVETVLNGYDLVVDSRDPSKKKIRYDFGGKFLESASITLADKIGDIQIGSKIRLKRTGAGMQTKYTVEKL